MLLFGGHLSTRSEGDVFGLLEDESTLFFNINVCELLLLSKRLMRMMKMKMTDWNHDDRLTEKSWMSRSTDAVLEWFAVSINCPAFSLPSKKSMRARAEFGSKMWGKKRGRDGKRKRKEGGEMKQQINEQIVSLHFLGRLVFVFVD